jgi:hypothetical protein
MATEVPLPERPTDGSEHDPSDERPDDQVFNRRHQVAETEVGELLCEKDEDGPENNTAPSSLRGGAHGSPPVEGGGGAPVSDAVGDVPEGAPPGVEGGDPPLFLGLNAACFPTVATAYNSYTRMIGRAARTSCAAETWVQNDWVQTVVPFDSNKLATNRYAPSRTYWSGPVVQFITRLPVACGVVSVTSRVARAKPKLRICSRASLMVTPSRSGAAQSYRISTAPLKGTWNAELIELTVWMFVPSQVTVAVTL